MPSSLENLLSVMKQPLLTWTSTSYLQADQLAAGARETEDAAHALMSILNVSEEEDDASAALLSLASLPTQQG